MDIDEVEATGKLPSRVTKFAPKSSKPKTKPKPPSEPHLQPKPEPQPPPPFKPEPQEFAAKKEDVDEIVAPPTHTKPEPNHTANTELAPKSEAQDETDQVDSMSLDLPEETAEDTVVREFDVFFGPSVDAATQLYVLQYPLRPRWRPYELEERCEEVRLNPKSSNMEIDLSVDLDSSNIDTETASRFNFTKQTLATKWNPSSANCYAVGLLKGDKFQLHPVNAVVQLRPAFHHLHSGGSKRKNQVSTGENATVKIEGSIEEKSAAAPKKQNKQTELSLGQQSDDDEGWVALKYHSCKSDISSRYLDKMMMHESHPIKFTMDVDDYVTALCPGVNNISSKRHLLSLPVEERLKKLLVEDPPFRRFSAIKHFAREYSDEELAEFLHKHAILIQGFWTAKSKLLSHKDDSGIGELARDFVILLFSKSLRVQASDLNLGGKVGNALKEWLNKFGLEGCDPLKSGGTLYWKFPEVPDDSFKKRHPNIAERQEEMLKNLEAKLSDFGRRVIVAKRKFDKDGVASQHVKSELVKSAKSEQVTSLSGASCGRMTMSNATRQALLVAITKLLQTHRVCSLQMMRQRLREMAISTSLLSKTESKVASDAMVGFEGPQEELKAVVSEVAYDIHGSYVLKVQDDPFRDVVITLLRGKSDGKLKKAEICAAATATLNREVTSNEYTRVMSELCVSKGSYWHLKSGDGSMQ
ncbi:hypothetical protein HN51_068587 [Arachis hypogaea]|uniref:uncharacterized protein LOC107642858 n=1 Tax=Arachis ipaensis TaxID=130454 RepID=UPI0007AF9718|nr:uncharacterized protein LOC107642858 [Arachis ipaensis]XP_025653111.1 uncharacterized protein LOC112749056 [Arachis hypogaea]QHO10665.1 DNA-directed RNA polymerase III subunit [Arachis hypogaea]